MAPVRPRVNGNERPAKVPTTGRFSRNLMYMHMHMYIVSVCNLNLYTCNLPYLSLNIYDFPRRSCVGPCPAMRPLSGPGWQCFPWRRRCWLQFFDGGFAWENPWKTWENPWKTYRKIFCKWRFSCENHLEMEVFMGKSIWKWRF